MKVEFHAFCFQSKLNQHFQIFQQFFELRVAATASITDIMKELAEEYQKEHPISTFNFGSSGALQQAIESGGATDIKDFKDLTREDIQHIALGEPKGVSVGQYSEEIFTKLNIIDAVKAKVFYGSDVRQVLSWVETIEADCGVVYATDAVVAGDKVKVIVKAPEGSHKPVIYPVAIIEMRRNTPSFSYGDISRRFFLQNF